MAHLQLKTALMHYGRASYPLHLSEKFVTLPSDTDIETLTQNLSYELYRMNPALSAQDYRRRMFESDVRKDKMGPASLRPIEWEGRTLNKRLLCIDGNGFTLAWEYVD